MKSIFTLVFLLPFSFVFAQNNSPENNLKKLVKLDLGLRGISITYEPKLNNKASQTSVLSDIPLDVYFIPNPT